MYQQNLTLLIQPIFEFVLPWF